MKDRHCKVVFKGQTYWYSTCSMGANISPLDHYDEEGNLLAMPLIDISYAVILLGSDKIMRYGQIIGTVDDLEFLS